MQDEWDFLHVYKPDYSKEEIVNILELISDYHYKVVLHSHFKLIHEFDLTGINMAAKVMANLSYPDEFTSVCDMRDLSLRDGQIYVKGQRPDYYNWFSGFAITYLAFVVVVVWILADRYEAQGLPKGYKQLLKGQNLNK